MSSGSKNVGIMAIEVYTPSTFVLQSKLEEHYGVAQGKYTIGLGQEGIGLCGDVEDINSLALTVVKSLMEKYNIDPNTVGRLEVGTETLVDKSKSTKTVLMSLFPGNTDIEGATVVNACYGGTAALLNAFTWVESDGWDGRYAIVVAADIAAYAKGPARPTCGAGAVAVLVGRDAPLAFNPRERATHAAHVWDFFKPDHTVEYPTVDGALSQVCYYQAIEDVYQRLAQNVKKARGENSNDQPFDSESPDYWVFHAPYNKLVQKSYGRMFLIDARRRRHEESEEKKESDTANPLEEWLTKPIEETYSDKALERALKTVSAKAYEQRFNDSNSASKLNGNTYTASVFIGLASLVDKAGSRGDLSPGKTIGVFSYGSGALATMYRLHVREPTEQSTFTVAKMAEALKLTERLAKREEVHPGELDMALDTRARMHGAGAPYTPVYPTVGRLFPGTYYLKEIDAKWRRVYERVPLDAKMEPHGTSLAPESVLRMADRDPLPEDGAKKQKV
ncbi:Hydroxymethylglutaryl-CoA synthase [Seminavis robusta]|uniref:Hydroxymethylglutaryl-CoA synthase n=1 Tax=Seminavis robusta TaxID=568900 RepID=A0A9N8DCQ5_9STRA|nr:Hydroxymethylglutaryl-CoA synthase [Seminavis robusta]|eukprot:Sro93_g048350.1 Hydroxymethylglutaryl-CoA synthase (505) ;mRNA; r:24772-26550